MKRLVASLAVLAGLSLPISASALQPVQSQVTETCHIWNGQRQVFSLNGYVGAASYIMVFDSQSQPTAGAVIPIIAPLYVPALGSWSIFFNNTPLSVVNGLVVCASSTGPLTYTAYTTATFSALTQ